VIGERERDTRRRENAAGRREWSGIVIATSPIVLGNRSRPSAVKKAQEGNANTRITEREYPEVATARSNGKRVNE
jgi:hypothetical protein